MFLSVVLVVAGFVAMEPITALTHRMIMHGFGHALHRSHHRINSSGWEANDLYPLFFASIVVLGLAVGFNVPHWGSLVPVGIGITLYGAAYALVHDVYIHGRLPLFRNRRFAALDRLADAHQVHHRRNGAPYGMLVPVLSRANGSRPSHVPVDSNG